MKKKLLTTVCAFALVLLTALMLIPALELVIDAEGEGVFVLEGKEMTAFAQGSKADGDKEKAGTDNYFTVYYSSKTKIDGSNKTFSDGYTTNQRINFGGKSDIAANKNFIQFTTNSPSTVKVWWVSGGDGRQVAVFDTEGSVLKETAEQSVKNSLYISTITLDAAGTYNLGGDQGNNYIFKVEVSETDASVPDARTPWSEVAAPTIASAEDNGEGRITVTVNAVTGDEGADLLVVTMYDSENNAVFSKNKNIDNTHTFEFDPPASGEYKFIASMSREGEGEVKEASVENVAFSYPLAAPSILSLSNKGTGKAELLWGAVHEATGYEVYLGDDKVDTVTVPYFVFDGLTVGEEITVKVAALRDAESKFSEQKSITVTEEAQTVWSFSAYGSSTNKANNGYVGDLNAGDSSVTVFSEGGKGKIVPASTDGLAFYYTVIPSAYNFTLRAKVTVDAWTLSNGQEGFGIMAADRVGKDGDTTAVWNNSYMAGGAKIEYRYEDDEEGEGTIYNVTEARGTKYTMKLGLGVISRTGVTKQNLPLFDANDTATINGFFKSRIDTLESMAGYRAMEAGTYNVFKNGTSAEGTLEERDLLTSVILEIQRNNTGYFVTYYDEAGNIITRYKFYEPDALSQIDSDYVYAGFFASRNARATFSDISFTTILASEDAPAEQRPVVKVDPIVTIGSAGSTTTKDYPLIVDVNAKGKLTISLDDAVIAENIPVEALERYRLMIELSHYDESRISVAFTPDADQGWDEYTVLSTTRTQYKTIEVDYNKGFYHRKSIYIAPDPIGLPNGNGTKEHPLDIRTAIVNAVPGQTLILMEGTYEFESSLRIERGINGTEAAMIRLIADPEAETRPVLDFQELSAGIVHGGDWWYFEGFDVTRSANAQKGFHVSGDHNVLDNINTYNNGNTGIQISRYSSSDLFPDWPSYNLILNCTSYNNADSGYEDADGFAAKLTIGEGNVFDGCVAYNNADDGWDLYAKVETGPIGAVTIRNCVAYSNGYLSDGTPAGNGNGFKLGGDSLSGKHHLINSYAFWNKAKGIDSNSCPDIIVDNCISYNNGKYNIAFYTNNAKDTDFFANGVISFKDASNAEVHSTLAAIDSKFDPLEGEQLKPAGTQDTSKYLKDSNYFFSGEKSLNNSGIEFTAAMFVSLNFTGVTRNADGSINMNGFLALADTAPEGVGADGSSSPSPAITVPADLECTFGETLVHNGDIYIHWFECECGNKKDIGNHSFETIVDKEPTAAEVGRKHDECTACGYERAAIEIPALGSGSTGGETPEDPGTDKEQPSDDNDGLSGGAIAGIAIGSVAVLGGGGFSIFWFVIKKKTFMDLLRVIRIVK